MQAIVHDEYGSADVLRLMEVEKPDVDAHEVLVRVRAACVNPYDWHAMTGLPLVFRLQSGLRGPKDIMMGADLAGHVEAVGSSVTRFRPGDEVLAEVESGSFAEYVAVSEEWAAPKPGNLTMEQAATVPMAALTALQGLRDHGRIEAGKQVLINGASGGVGTFAVQIAKAFGAQVTGVCSARNAEMVRSLGADHVVDYTREDFTLGGRRFDLMFDLIGNHSPSACRRVLTAGGTYVASFGQPSHRWLGPIAYLARMLTMAPFVRQRMVTFVAKPNREDFGYLKELIEAGKVTPVIDRTYPLSETATAMAYLEEGHARGKVAVSV
jgi:NADPH:quinone reductase-like Zn-dependent oxidoreductase